MSGDLIHFSAFLHKSPSIYGDRNLQQTLAFTRSISAFIDSNTPPMT
jgi:CRISPR/Cas system CMR-associated protein Cmr5 small subunit